MSALGVLDAIFLAYFIIHIPTTLLVDSQSGKQRGRLAAGEVLSY